MRKVFFNPALLFLMLLAIGCGNPTATPVMTPVWTPTPGSISSTRTPLPTSTPTFTSGLMPMLIITSSLEARNFAYSSDGKMIVVGYAKTINIYDANLKNELAEFAKPWAGISESGKVVFFNKDTALAAEVNEEAGRGGIGTNGSIYVWDLTTNLLKNQYPMEGLIEDFDVSYDGTWLAIADDVNFSVTLWNLKSGRKHIWETISYDLAFSPTELVLAVPGWAEPGDSALRILDLSTDRAEELFYQPENLSEQASRRAEDVAFSPDGRLLALVVNDQLRLWDMEAAQEIVWPISITWAPLIQVEISSNDTLATLDETGLITLFNGYDGRSLGIIKAEGVERITFFPSGEFLLIGGRDYPLQIWQTPS